MSGLNPFRPKKPENPVAHPSKHHHSQSSPSLSIVPDTIFFKPPLSAAGAASQLNLPSSSSNTTTTTNTPLPPIHTPEIDNSVASDEQSTLDPFHQDSYLSDDDVEAAHASGPSITAPPGDHRHHPRGSDRVSPPFVSSSSAPVTPSWERPQKADMEIDGISHERTTAHSDVSSQSSTSQEDSDSSISADVYRPPIIRTGTTGSRPLSLVADIDPRALASRPGNRERIPPPPPRSHHGKLIISPDSTRPLSASQQTTPGKASNRFSFHESSPGLSPSPQVSHSGPDYFSGSTTSQLTPSSTDALKRSQSQHKRPPTPPLSRRHSQMRRSKSTLAKPTSSQLSMHPINAEATSSSPPSPGSLSLTPSRSRQPKLDTTFPDEPSANSALRFEKVVPIEVPTSTGLSNPRPVASKRASLSNPLPPPPPPRRTRGASNHSIDNSRPASIRSEQRLEGSENFVPHPSNAKDILADLSRLQKEVDDLRGHYESRRAS